MIIDVDCVVIGAGVVGLAIAKSISSSGREVYVLESADRIGTQTSSHNSEVMHAGLYYKTDSLKAQFCLEGYRKLQSYCSGRGIGFKKIGKLIVATHANQQKDLESLQKNAFANSVTDVKIIDEKSAKNMEPELSCYSALLSPKTGIIDSHAFMLGLHADIQDAGSKVVFHSPVLRGELSSAGIILHLGDKEKNKIKVRWVVNAAGLWAQEVAKSIEGFPVSKIPKIYFAKGNYFSLKHAPPFKRLIYPLPGRDHSVGIHTTLDMDGRTRFGPDIQWVDEIDYSVDLASEKLFYDSIREYYPGLKDNTLQPDYAGVRPRLSGPGEGFSDFVVQDPEDHGSGKIINLFGIESPGLTASMAIGDYVAKKIQTLESV